MEAVGSRYYIASENESGISDEVDQRPADFYAFGKISWSVLTGRPPLASELQLDQRNRVATKTIDEKLAAWDEVCEQLLRLDPRTRLDDWPTVRSELASLLRDPGSNRNESASTSTKLDALAAAAALRAKLNGHRSTGIAGCTAQSSEVLPVTPELFQLNATVAMRGP